jgi:NADPH:quinone reductase-like Zn-dependent oxidoreductase
MRAVVRDRYGTADALKLVDVESPRPGPNDVLVRVCAASINDWDWALIRGEFTNRLMQGLVRPRIHIPGGDFAGRVEAVGADVTQLQPGEAVYGDLCMSGFGTFAEKVCAPVSCLCRMPEGMSFEQAAAIPQAGMLAVQGLMDVGKIRDRMSRILINGAGGGVGTFALQLAARYGVEVTCVDRGDKLSKLCELGASRVIDYEREDFTRGSSGYDLILDARTSRPGSAYLRALNPGGIYATVGGDIRRLAALAVRRRLRSERGGRQLRIVVLSPNRDLEFMNGEFEAGRMELVIDRVYPLDETAEAIRRFARSDHVGKIVISTGSK